MRKVAGTTIYELKVEQDFCYELNVYFSMLFFYLEIKTTADLLDLYF